MNRLRQDVSLGWDSQHLVAGLDCQPLRNGERCRFLMRQDLEQGAMLYEEYRKREVVSWARSLYAQKGTYGRSGTPKDLCSLSTDSRSSISSSGISHFDCFVSVCESTGVRSGAKQCLKWLTLYQYFRPLVKYSFHWVLLKARYRTTVRKSCGR